MKEENAREIIAFHKSEKCGCESIGHYTAEWYEANGFIEGVKFGRESLDIVDTIKSFSKNGLNMGDLHDHYVRKLAE